MSELDDLFNMCLNSELPDQENMRKQFDATFSYNAPKSKFLLCLFFCLGCSKNNDETNRTTEYNPQYPNTTSVLVSKGVNQATNTAT